MIRDDCGSRAGRGRALALLSWLSARRTWRPRTSATRADSPCARAAATRRTGLACSRVTTSWPWASEAATCPRSARCTQSPTSCSPPTRSCCCASAASATCRGLRAAGAGGAGDGRGRRAGAGVWVRAAAPSSLTPPRAQAVKALQTATREAIALLQAMVEEVRHSAAEEEDAIHALFGSMQVHLVICSSFLSLANKAEFLDLGYELMERLQGIVTRPHRLRPAQSSKIASDHRAEFARCLEPLLLLGPRRVAAAVGGANTLAGGSGPKVLTGPHCPSPVGKMSRSPVQKPTLHRSMGTKVLLVEGENTPFTRHCRHYEDSYRRLQVEMQNLKDQVQELHRDLTKHHSLIKAEIMGDVLHKSLQLDTRIASEHASLEGMRVIFQEIWEESYQRVANEQEIYEAQLHDLLQLRQENAYLTTITRQITPYVLSIAKVKERLEPRFQAPVDEQSESLQNTQDESRNGVALARNNPGSVPEKREKTSETKGNTWALNSLSEELLPKNKDHHRPKEKNGGNVPARREHLT
ncbi:RING finger protein 207 isoform X2 [Callithrix jacchus]